MTPRENILRAARFERPERIPVSFGVNPACWDHYDPEALADLMEAHPALFPGFDRSVERRGKHPPWRRAGRDHTDSWGCVWRTQTDGLTGAVIRHPLADWADLETYQPPDPARHAGWDSIDWDAVADGLARAEREGRLRRGGLRHGHTFLTLTYIRGYENLIYDMADGDPRLDTLIGMVESFNAEIVRRYVELGVEWMGYPEDLGMQQGPMLSPEHFRRYIKPVYERLMAPARAAGCVIHMHSDGDIRALAEDLIDDGIDVLNLQDLVNTIDWIRDNLKGRVCIDLDLDRQRITRFGTPPEIDRLVRAEVETLGSPEGGLMFTYGLYPGTPLENVAAVMDALDRYATCYT